MATDPTNGGKRISKLEVTDAEHGTKISLIERRVNEIHTLLTDYFGPDGFCVQHQKRMARIDEQVGSNRGWIKALWAVAIVLGVAAVKAAFF